MVKNCLTRAKAGCTVYTLDRYRIQSGNEIEEDTAMIKPRVFETSSFTVSEKAFVAELSNFEYPMSVPMGAEGFGFEIKSAKTGRIAAFVESRIERDGEGDIRFIEYAPTRKALKENPMLSGWVARLFND
jgi:hypothetical protein